MSAWSTGDIDFVVEYLAKINDSLSTFLRPFKGQLGDHWLGVDRGPTTIHIFFSPDGLVANIGSFTEDQAVQTRLDKSFQQNLTSGFPPYEVTGPVGHAEVNAKMLAGDGKFGMTINKAGDRSITLLPNKEASFVFVAPKIYEVSQDQIEVLKKIPSDKGREKEGIASPIPPWIVSIVAARTGKSSLDGLDDDPIIAAKGIAEMILLFAGINAEVPAAKYRSAYDDLLNAIKTINKDNEKAIHAVIKNRPWILLDESHYKRFDDEVALSYTEREKHGDDIVEVTKTIIPDFVYDKYEETLIVEIEAATKQLLKLTKETGAQLPTAQAIAAQFQIMNYHAIINGPSSQDLRAVLGKPDSWRFEFLLVVGSKHQDKFDQRSWEILRGHIPKDITLRNWDFYLEWLKRVEKASTFQV